MKVIHVKKSATTEETGFSSVMLDDFTNIDHIKIKSGVVKIVHKNGV